MLFRSHRETVGGRVRQCREAIQKPGRGHGQADAGLLCHVPGDCRGIARILFMSKTNESHSLRLRKTRQVGDRDTHEAEDRIDVIALQRIDDQMKAVRQFGLLDRSQFRLLKVGARKNAF